MIIVQFIMWGQYVGLKIVRPFIEEEHLEQIVGIGIRIRNIYEIK